ncbi:hypothetical protein D3C87_2112690 [compost metagenome]
MILQKSRRHEQPKVPGGTGIISGQTAYGRDTPPRHLEEDLLNLDLIELATAWQLTENLSKGIAIRILYLR